MVTAIATINLKGGVGKSTMTAAMAEIMAGSFPGTVGDLTSHTAYRIVQEALTNSQKHAPGSPLQITVSGADTDGISLVVRNPAASGSPGPGSRSGLVGLAEQAQTAGGWVRWDVHGGEFVLSAWLPWYS